MKPKKFLKQNQESERHAYVRILATSDLHMHLTSYDYYADRPDSGVGFTRTSSLIHEAREQAESHGALVLLFDNGDSLQGTPFGEWAAEISPDAHPLPQAFNALGYDAIGLGNHDFGFGLDFVKGITKQTACPVVCSNLQSSMPDQGWVAHANLQRHVTIDGKDVPIRIGVLSVLPPQVTQWEAHMLKGRVKAIDILSAARRTAIELREQGCDLVIALAHTGLGAAKAEPEMENAIIPLAELAEIDAFIAGHTHLTLPGKAHHGLPFVDCDHGLVHGKPVVMQGWAGSHLGIIDLILRQARHQGWSVAEVCVEARSVKQEDSETPECPEMMRLFAEGHTATRSRVAKPVGSIEHSLHSYFSYCSPDRGLTLIAAAQAAALRPHLAGSVWADLPVLSAAAPSKFGGRAGPRYYTDVPTGDISLRHLADISVFPNELRALVVTGSQIQDWLEMSAGLFNQLHEGDPINLADPKRAGFNFDILHGLTYQIDLSQPARYDPDGRLNNPEHARIQNIALDGKPVAADQKFIVATNNYRANGGGNFPIVQNVKMIDLPPISVQEILCDYVSGALPADPLLQCPRPFSFLPTPGQGAILTTGPGARKHLGELSEYRPCILPDDEDGFMRIHLSF